MDPSQRLTPSPEVIFQEVSGELVLLDLESEQYFGLNEVGARIWQLLDQGCDLQAVYDALLSEYEVEDSVLRGDLEQLLAQLLEAGLLRRA